MFQAFKGPSSVSTTATFQQEGQLNELRDVKLWTSNKIKYIYIYTSKVTMRWAGHVIRQDDDDLSRRVLVSEPGGKRPRG